MNDNKKAALISAIITIMGITSIAAAGESDRAAQDAYQQIVVNNQDKATVYVNDDTETTDVIGELIMIDKETPYDAEMAIYRAPSLRTVRYSNGKLEIILENPINVKESEELLDVMENEIRSNLKESHTQGQALDEITDYIIDTYKYSATERNSDGLHQNFIEAYNSDRQITCTQYAALTYLLCDRFGIDCKIIVGNDHVYNAIKLDGEDTYTAYDLSKADNKLLPAKVSYVETVTGGYSVNLETDDFTRANGTLINERIDFKYSFTYIEGVIIILVLALVILAAILSSIKKDIKGYRRRDM